MSSVPIGLDIAYLTIFDGTLESKDHINPFSTDVEYVSTAKMLPRIRMSRTLRHFSDPHI